MRFRRESTSWLVEVPGGLVGWMSGGEPVGGCEAISVLIFASTGPDVRSRASEIGLWDAYKMDFLGEPDPDGVEAALTDPEHFVWKHPNGDEWRPSIDLARR